MSGRDINEAALRLSSASNKELATLVRRDPDMIRDVARAAIKPPRKPCPICGDKDPECELCGGVAQSRESSI
jgi:hypothetical protein